jgi:hypothetical protein
MSGFVDALRGIAVFITQPHGGPPRVVATPVDVQMRVTAEDAQRAAKIMTRHGLASKAHAVSAALEFADKVSEAIVKDQARVVLKYPSGRCAEVVARKFGLT